MRMLLCQLSVLTVFSLVATVQDTHTQRFLPDPHHHLVPVHEMPWTTDTAPGVRVTRLDSPVTGHDTVFSANRRFSAFVIERPGEQGGRVSFLDSRSRRQYEVRGVPLTYRPISDLLWLNDTLLTFDRWSQPHYGIHYVVDVRHRRLLLASPFPDEFYLRQQKTQNDSGVQHR